MPSAAILAGGRATRFGGHDKAALVVRGRSILDRQIEELSQIADEILIVVSAETARTGGTRSALDVRIENARASSRYPGDLSVRVVSDRVADCGPLGGLDAALGAARSDPVVVVACDMPFVTARFLGHLLSLTREADAVVPRTEDGYHPLCAVYTRACLPRVARRLAEGRLAMIELLGELRLREVTGREIESWGESARLLTNVNTPATFDELEAQHDHKP